MANLDWSWLQSFLMVAQSGSFSEAARHLDVSQPTVSRHVRALEGLWGRPLFVRHNRGIELTDAGQRLLAGSRGLANSVATLLRHKDSEGEDPAGTVRVSVNEPLGLYILPSWVTKLRNAHPRIQLELSIDNSSADLTRHEADLAVRMYRPQQQSLVAKKIADSELGLYAHERYLQRHGEPRAVEDLERHTFTGLDRDPQWAPLLRRLGLRAGAFALRSDSLAFHVQALLAGVAVVSTHVSFAERHSELRRVLPEVEFLPLEVWVVMHEELRADPTVSAVFRSLVDFLTCYFVAPEKKLKH